MAMLCFTITVVAPKIISTDLTINLIDCIEPCSINVIVTWQNTGDTYDTFIPAIIVGDKDPIILPSEQLAVGEIVSRSFIVSGLEKGSYTICPSPSGAPCKTLDVYQKESTDIGPLLMGGLLLGLLLRGCGRYTNTRDCAEDTNCIWIGKKCADKSKSDERQYNI